MSTPSTGLGHDDTRANGAHDRRTLDDRIVREDERKTLTGISRTYAWELEQAGKFPKRRRIAGNVTGWSYIELQQWVRERLHGKRAA